MPRDPIIMRGTYEPPGTIIERKILGLYWQRVYHRLNQAAAQKAWHRQIGARHLMAEIHRITGEQLITAITAERDRDVLSGKPRQQISRHERRIADWLVHPGADFAHQIRGETRTEPLLMM